MSEVTIGIIGLGVVLALFMTGIELSFAMIAVGFVGFGYLMSWEAALNLLAKDFFDVLTSYSLTVVPLFIFMGQVAFNSGIAKKLFDASYKYVGHIPGGLAISTVVGATAFKAICGSTTATTATFASVAVPEMERYGYDRRPWERSAPSCRRALRSSYSALFPTNRSGSSFSQESSPD
jgi:C4-dicarboxylate transporter DctM subunit